MAEADLKKLLSAIDPGLHDKEFVFCTLSEDDFKQLQIIPQCLFREEEGLTIIVKKTVADELGLAYTNCWALITCKIDSDLAAVGFLAAMSTVLAEAGIAVNAVSAYFHDHLFVPANRKEEAMKLLQRLSAADSLAG